MKKKLITTAAAVALTLASMVPALAAQTTSQAVTVEQAETDLLKLYNQLPTWPNYPEKSMYGFGIGLKYLVGGNSNASAAADPATAALLFGSNKSSAVVTANQVAGWIIRWAKTARNVNLTAWAAKSEYQLVQLWGMFAGTGIVKGTDRITAKQEKEILANMKQAFGEVGTVNPFKKLTMQSEIEHLIKWENTVPVWPAGLETYDPNSGTAYWKNPNMKIPQSKWFGLAPIYGPNAIKDLQIESAYEPQLPVTAGVLAHWIISFEKDARKLDMKLEPTQNEFQLLKDFGVFWRTGITSPTQILTAKQSNQIMENLNAVTYGLRVNKNKVQFVEPLMSAQGMVIDWEGLSEINKSLKNDWPNAYGQLTKEMDTMSLTFTPGGKITYNRAKSNQIGLGLDVAYVTPAGHVYSELYRAGGTNYAKPSAFNLPVPFTYSPTENATSYNIKGFQYKLKNSGDALVSVMFMPFNRETWKVAGYTIAPQPRYLVEFNKQTGNIVAVSLYGQAGQNYPAEVENVE